MSGSDATGVGPAPAAAVHVEGFSLRAGPHRLLDHTAAHFEPGRISLIVGASGAGKSLLLRIIAGLHGPGDDQVRAEGRIHIERPASSLGNAAATTANAPPSIGVVFQQFALFDELTPLENVRFALAHRGARRAKDPLLSDPAALLQHLNVPMNVRTTALSGGQQQRLAIARALAHDPDVVLYDEPTSGLDSTTAARVASLIRETHRRHPRTVIIVTHDYTALLPIADACYLLDTKTRSLKRIEPHAWPDLPGMIHPPAAEPAAAPATAQEVAGPEPGESAATGTGPSPDASTVPPADAAADSTPQEAPSPAVAAPAPRPRLGTSLLRSASTALASAMVATSRGAETAAELPYRLIPTWPSPRWGVRYVWHYLLLVAGPSAWVYLAIIGAILGFVATDFIFRFMPYTEYTEPLLTEALLEGVGFALYRVLVPLMATVLIAARCGAAVAADVGGRTYNRQFDAMRSLGAPPRRYLLTGILYAFLLGTPLLVLLSFFTARLMSLAVFTVTHPHYGPWVWRQNFHGALWTPDRFLYEGTGWMLAKVLCCAAGIAVIAYHRGAAPKPSGRAVSRGVTSTILWATIFVLLVHFTFAFFEY